MTLCSIWSKSQNFSKSLKPKQTNKVKTNKLRLETMRSELMQVETEKQTRANVINNVRKIKCLQSGYVSAARLRLTDDQTRIDGGSVLVTASKTPQSRNSFTSY